MEIRQRPHAPLG